MKTGQLVVDHEADKTPIISGPGQLPGMLKLEVDLFLLQLEAASGLLKRNVTRIIGTAINTG